MTQMKTESLRVQFILECHILNSQQHCKRSCLLIWWEKAVNDNGQLEVNNCLEHG